MWSQALEHCSPSLLRRAGEQNISGSGPTIKICRYIINTLHNIGYNIRKNGQKIKLLEKLVHLRLWKQRSSISKSSDYYLPITTVLNYYFDSGISGRSVLAPPGDISMMYAELSVDSSFRWPPERMAWVSLTGIEFLLRDFDRGKTSLFGFFVNAQLSSLVHRRHQRAKGSLAGDLSIKC